MNYCAKLLLNSLYGRFGMDDQFTQIEIMTQKDIDKIMDKHKESKILDMEELSPNKFLVQFSNEKQQLTTMIDTGEETHNINIAIASSITAYSRIHMSQFKNNPNFILYYSDTDSIYIDRLLLEEFVNSKELGKMKLEGIYQRAVFLAPKFYGLEDEEGNITIKIKGLSQKAIQENNITLDTLESLLEKDKVIEAKQEKWFK
jgi:hypothetical protein